MPDGRPILLMLRARGLGDLLTAVPALRALAAAFPTHRRVLATTAPLAPLALRAGFADEIVPMQRLAPIAWRQHPPAIAVNLHDRGSDSHRVLLATCPARLIAFRHPLVAQSWDGPDWYPDEHDVGRWCRLLSESGVAVDPSRLDVALPSRPVPAEAIGATVLHPGGAGPTRRWPMQRWAEVALAESLERRTVLITGSAADRGLALAIAHRAGLPANVVWAGRTDLLALAAIVERAARVVCGETGVAHLATALRIPSVVLFGSTLPAAAGPPTYRPWHRVLWAETCGGDDGTRTGTGLLRITVEDVMAALESLPAATPRPGWIDPAARRLGSARPAAARVRSGSDGAAGR